MSFPEVCAVPVLNVAGVGQVRFTDVLQYILKSAGSFACD